MKEQAAILTEKSKNRLRAETLTSVTTGNNIRETFYLVVPSLDNYRYELFEIEHGALPYPVTVISMPKPANALAAFGRVDLASETEFIAWLRRVLSSLETKKIIGALFAQANA